MIKVNFHDKWIPEPFSGCWLWTASVRPDGYGQVRFKGKMERQDNPSWFRWGFKCYIRATLEVV